MTLERLIKVSKDRGISREVVVARIQRLYQRAASAGALHVIQSVEEITGLNPELTEEFLEQGFRHILSKGQYSKLKPFSKATHCEIPARLVQEKYATLIDQCNGTNVFEVKAELEIILEETGIEPTTELKGVYTKKMIETFPEQKEMIEMCEAMWSHVTGKGGPQPFSFNRPAHTPPGLSQSIVQETYHSLARSGDYEGFYDFYKKTSVKPELSEPYIQSLYAACVGKGASGPSLDRLEDLITILEICPKEGLLQKAYADAGREGFYSPIVRLKSLTGIQPKYPSDVTDKIQGSLECYAGEGLFGYLNKFYSGLGVPPTEKFFENFVTFLFEGEEPYVETVPRV